MVYRVGVVDGHRHDGRKEIPLSCPEMVLAVPARTPKLSVHEACGMVRKFRVAAALESAMSMQGMDGMTAWICGRHPSQAFRRKTVGEGGSITKRSRRSVVCRRLQHLSGADAILEAINDREKGLAIGEADFLEEDIVFWKQNKRTGIRLVIPWIVWIFWFVHHQSSFDACYQIVYLWIVVVDGIKM